MRKIMKVLKDEANTFNLNFIQDRGENIVLGVCCPTDEGFQITLNPIDIFLPTLIHELIHAAYPEKSETAVVKYTKVVLATLTRRRRKNIFMKWLVRGSEHVQND